VHSPGGALTDLAEGEEEHFSILVVQENRFPPIAAAEQVIERPIEFYPRHSGHRARMCRLPITDKNKDMTPFAISSKALFFDQQFRISTLGAD
jgi:hypothetical protein